MLISRLLFGLMALTPSLAAEVKDLGTTLGGIKELSTYFALVKVGTHTIMAQSPSLTSAEISQHSSPTAELCRRDGMWPRPPSLCRHRPS